MPRNGSGTYSAPSNSWNPPVNGVNATAADWATTQNDYAAALTQSVSSDGQTPMTGNLPMGNNKITGLANGTASTDAVNFGQMTGRLINTQTITATGVYTPTAGTTSVIVELIGGGASGTGTPANSASQLSTGSGGGSGSWGRGRYTSAFSGVTVTIGSGGTGVANSGTAGGNSSFGALLVCPGGNFGGNTQQANTVPGFFSSASPPPSAPSGSGIIYGTVGVLSGMGFIFGTSGVSIGGAGASSPYGSGGTPGNAGVGGAASGYGAGGGGAASGASAAAFAGGSGRPGICIIYEFA